MYERYPVQWQANKGGNRRDLSIWHRCMVMRDLKKTGTLYRHIHNGRVRMLAACSRWFPCLAEGLWVPEERTEKHLSLRHVRLHSYNLHNNPFQIPLGELPCPQSQLLGLLLGGDSVPVSVCAIDVR